MVLSETRFQVCKGYGLESHQYKVTDDVFMAAELEVNALNEVFGIVKYPESFAGV